MQYVIYNNKAKAESRHSIITDDARISNFLNPGEDYEPVIYHPTDDLAALPILVIEAQYIDDLPTQRYDYGIFFTDMEKATAVSELPEDWTNTAPN